MSTLPASPAHASTDRSRSIPTTHRRSFGTRGSTPDAKIPSQSLSVSAAHTARCETPVTEPAFAVLIAVASGSDAADVLTCQSIWKRLGMHVSLVGADVDCTPCQLTTPEYEKGRPTPVVVPDTSFPQLFRQQRYTAGTSSRHVLLLPGGNRGVTVMLGCEDFVRYLQLYPNQNNDNLLVACGASATRVLTTITAESMSNSYVDPLGHSCWTNPYDNTVLYKEQPRVWTSPGGVDCAQAVALSVGEELCGTYAARKIAQEEIMAREASILVATVSHEDVESSSNILGCDGEELLLGAAEPRCRKRRRWRQRDCVDLVVLEGDDSMLNAAKRSSTTQSSETRAVRSSVVGPEVGLRVAGPAERESLIVPTRECATTTFIAGEDDRGEAVDTVAEVQSKDWLFSHVVWPRLMNLGWTTMRQCTKVLSFCPPGDKAPLKDAASVLDYLWTDPHWSLQTQVLSLLDLYESCKSITRDMEGSALPEEIEQEAKRRKPALASY